MHRHFQAVFSDIDGTLLNPQHQLSHRNRAAGWAQALEQLFNLPAGGQ